MKAKCFMGLKKTITLTDTSRVKIRWGKRLLGSEQQGYVCMVRQAALVGPQAFGTKVRKLLQNVGLGCVMEEQRWLY